MQLEFSFKYRHLKFYFFVLFQIGQYIHLVVWQTSEKLAMVNEDTDLSSFEENHPTPKIGGATP